MTGLPEVVSATVSGHPVIAVKCSTVPGRPWLTVHVGKGWTTAEPDEALENRVVLERLDVEDMLVSAVHTSMDHIADILGVGIPDEDMWRITSHDDAPFQADPVEAWNYCVDAIDRYGFVDRIEQQVDGTWRQRSIRDLLEHAGGDPL